MASKATTDAIQQDWKEREMIEVVHLNILKITKFLNEFEVSVRYKLSTLAERVGSLERHLEYCETAVKDKQQLQQFDSSSRIDGGHRS
ncbi:unnamed protein product [Ectocarpus sp. CCAP 1310/34]|nr:unnamed protein product [Ectocarpus sp. CCAP 1310/34]